MGGGEESSVDVPVVPLVVGRPSVLGVVIPSSVVGVVLSSSVVGNVAISSVGEGTSVVEEVLVVVGADDVTERDIASAAELEMRGDEAD